jgi:hypothetical protein
MLAALLLLILAACSPDAAMRKIASPQDQAFARAAIADVAAGNADDLAAKLDPSLRPALAASLPQMREMLPRGGLKLVGAHASTNLNQGTTQVNMTWEASDRQHYALVSTSVAHAGGTPQLIELRIYPTPRSVAEGSRLDLHGKSFVHYLFLALAVAAFLLCLLGVFLAFRTRGLTYRWLWAIGSIVAVGQISIRWSDGDIFMKPINLQFFGGFALSAGPLAPWQVGFGIPIVTFVLIHRRRLLRQRRDETPDQPTRD